MKYYETTCAEYIAASKCHDMHPELASISDTMPESLSELGNIIFYGPPGTGKYTQFLRFVERYAQNGLKTEKMTAATEKQKYEYHISDIHYEIDLSLLGCESKKLWNECFFQIVDVVSAKKMKCGIILCKNFQSIHSELLDVFYSYMQHCRALSIHIVFVLLTEHASFIPNRILQCCKLIPVKRPSTELYLNSQQDIPLSIPLIRSTHCASSEATKYIAKPETPPLIRNTLDDFFSKTPSVKLGSKSHKTFLRQIHPLRSNFSSLQNTINIQYESRDSEANPSSETNLSSEAAFTDISFNGPTEYFANTTITPEHFLNMKEIHSIAKVDSPPKDVFNIVCDNIIAKMIEHETLDIISLRDNLYDILLYGLDVTECLWYILYYFAESREFAKYSGCGDTSVSYENETHKVLSEIMDKIDSFLKYYNNNYRPIYHLESMFIYLITKIYRYPIVPIHEQTARF